MQVQVIPFDLLELRNTEKFNSCNHWVKEGVPPEDYEAVMRQTFTEHWIDKFQATYLKITIDDLDVKLLRKIRMVYLFMDRISEIFKEELQSMAEKYDRLFVLTKKYFVRARNVSLKYNTEHRNIGHQSFQSIFEAVVTCPPSHAPDLDDSSFALYLIPWIDLNPDLEFRVFVHQQQITAISQQFLYRANHTLTVQNVTSYVQPIIDYFRTTIKHQIQHIHSYCFDIAYDMTGKLYFIEINPFGQEYSSGSALFHWVKDKKVLLNRNEIITVRFTRDQSKEV